MLRLRTQAIQRIGKPYICHQCISSIHSAFASGLHTTYQSQHGRAFSNTSTKAFPVTETSKPASPDLSAKPPKKKKRPPPKALKKRAKPVAATTQESPKDSQRQLKVLEGALLALKNVLQAQNINVDDIIKPARNAVSRKNGKSKDAKKKLGNIGDDGVTATAVEGQNAKIPAPKEKPKKDKLAKTVKHVVKGEVSQKEVKSAPETVDGEQPKRKSRIRHKRPSPRAGRVAPVDKVHDVQTSPPTEKIASAESQSEPNAMGSKELGGRGLLPLGMRPAVRHKLPLKGVASELPLFSKSDLYQRTRRPESKPVPKPGKTEDTSSPTQDLGINTINSDDFNMVPIEKPQPPVPSVSYGLDRVLFNPGVYHLQDPRSKVYNFDPYLQKIMPIHEFDFNALKQYVTSSKDDMLISVAREHKKRYTGSTSSMTSVLSHFHYLLSSWREINSQMMTKGFEVSTSQFTRFMRAPAATFLHWKDGVYAIDADKEFDTATILSMLGKSMEKLLTLPKEEYERYRHVNSDQITEEERNASEAFHYTGLGDFMMRSQLDAYDPRIPGTGMFDLKTRAVISIRMDARNVQKGTGYEIRQRNGNWQSFEREYHDMIRAAFLKYSLQVRMGRMDGIFVAYHNTKRIFGFQYVPLEEMDLSIHGTNNLALGDKEFRLSLGLLNEVLNRATTRFPEKSLRLHFETRASAKTPFMYIFARPVEPGDIKAVQEASQEAIEAFERKVLGLKREADTEASTDAEAMADTKAVENDDIADEDRFDEEESASLQDMDGDGSWEEMRLVVEDAIEDDELGVAAVREAIEDALEESGLLEAQSPEEAGAYVNALLSAVTDGHTDASGTLVESSESVEVDVDHDEDFTTTGELTLGIGETEEEQGDEVDVESQNTDEEIVDQTFSQEDATTASEEGATVADTNNDDLSLHGYTTLPESDSEQVMTKISEDEPETSPEPERSTSPKNGAAKNETDGVESDLQGEHDAEDEASSVSSMSTLRNLILRMARRIEEKRFSKEQQQIAEDSSKLQDFERILGKMIARSRADNDHKQKSKLTSSGRASELDASTDSSLERSAGMLLDNEEESAVSSSADGAAAVTEPRSELLGFVLTIRNKVNDHYVIRPDDLQEADKWTLEYKLEELPDKRAQNLYEMCQKRRQTINLSSDDKDTQWSQMFKGQLKAYTNMGSQFRKAEDEEAKKRPVFTFGEEGSRTYAEVFGLEEDAAQDQEDQD